MSLIWWVDLHGTSWNRTSVDPEQSSWLTLSACVLFFLIALRLLLWWWLIRMSHLGWQCYFCVCRRSWEALSVVFILSAAWGSKREMERGRGVEWLSRCAFMGLLRVGWGLAIGGCRVGAGKGVGANYGAMCVHVCVCVWRNYWHNALRFIGSGVWSIWKQN